MSSSQQSDSFTPWEHVPLDPPPVGVHTDGVQWSPSVFGQSPLLMQQSLSVMGTHRLVCLSHWYSSQSSGLESVHARLGEQQGVDIGNCSCTHSLSLHFAEVQASLSAEQSSSRSHLEQSSLISQVPVLSKSFANLQSSHGPQSSSRTQHVDGISVCCSSLRSYCK